LSTAAQVSALRSGAIDVGLLRERPAVEEFDAMLVVRENLGVLLASELAAGLVCPDGVRLDALSGLQWLCFLRSDSPAWHDEVTAILRSHGVDLGPPPPEDQQLIAEVKLAAVTAGGSFALAPEKLAAPYSRIRDVESGRRSPVGAAHMGGVASKFAPPRHRPACHRVRGADGSVITEALR
jgi:hypothetical protein